MIFLFEGWGILAPLFGILGLLLGIALTTGPNPADPSVALVVGAVAAAVTCWFVGEKLNGGNRKLSARHSFMFIPLQWYAVPYGAIAILIIVSARQPEAASSHSQPSNSPTAQTTSSMKVYRCENLSYNPQGAAFAFEAHNIKTKLLYVDRDAATIKETLFTARDGTKTDIYQPGRRFDVDGTQVEQFVGDAGTHIKYGERSLPDSRMLTAIDFDARTGLMNETRALPFGFGEEATYQCSHL